MGHLDLSDKTTAAASSNKTALFGVFIMNQLLALAYVGEVIKGTRTLGSYAWIACFCIAPCVIALFAYLKNTSSLAVRYICSIGFCVLYTYVMFTTSSSLAFCYVIVIMQALIVYIDLKLMLIMSGYALVINIIIIVRKAMAGTLVGVEITNAELIIACLVMTTLYMILSIKKIDKINQANINKADEQRDQSEGLLEKTLSLAGSMSDNIRNAVEETQNLNAAIGATQQSMEELTAGAEEETVAINIQMENTQKINQHISGVEDTVNAIVGEVEAAEINLTTGNDLMKDLLHQVQISETSSAQVAQRMVELKEAADQMQEIMVMISNIASQTGLLALNASIEAARAGEAGRGFAVVASEISNLSAQTNSATSDINGLIGSIVQSVDDVTHSMNSLLESSQLQNQYVDQTADNFQNIHQSTQRIFNQVSGLKDMVVEVAEANRQIEENIANVNDITKAVMDEAMETLECCNVNLESVAKVSELMDDLMADAEQLQQ